MHLFKIKMFANGKCTIWDLRIFVEMTELKAYSKKISQKSSVQMDINYKKIK